MRPACSTHLPTYLSEYGGLSVVLRRELVELSHHLLRVLLNTLEERRGEGEKGEVFSSTPWRKGEGGGEDVEGGEGRA